MNREQWLSDGKARLNDLFIEKGYSLPSNIAVSCSWPSKSIRKRIGEAWSPEVSPNGTYETFISPILDDPIRVLDVLTHELIHHAVGVDKGHGKAFRDCALSLGLEGKMTATYAGEELTKRLNAIVEKLGPYPHGAIQPSDNKKKQGTRLIKCECPSCGYVARTTNKWIDTYGAPICPCNHETMDVPQ